MHDMHIIVTDHSVSIGFLMPIRDVTLYQHSLSTEVESSAASHGITGSPVDTHTPP